MDANLNEYHERVVLFNDKIIKVYSSDREDGCLNKSVDIYIGVNSWIVSIYYLFHQQTLGNLYMSVSAYINIANIELYDTTYPLYVKYVIPIKQSNARIIHI